MIKLFKTVNSGDWTNCKKDGEAAWWIKENCDIWYCQSGYEDKDEIKQHGFMFHWTKKVWFTPERDKACKLAEFAVDTDLRNDLMGLRVHQTTSLAISRAESTNKILLHPEGEEYMPFQCAGIEYMMARKNILLADDMGLGKTIQVLGLINNTPEIKTVLVVCPKSVQYNWMIEAKKWLNVPGDERRWKYGIGDTNTVPLPEYGYNFVIFNYDPVRKLEINHALSSVEWDLLVIDEAHKYRNSKTVGYQSIIGGKDYKDFHKMNAKRMVFTTGTPVENFVSELYPLITILDPEHWGPDKFWYFYKRYCNAERTGANMERLDELQTKLRETIMIRRLKTDVLKELPGKRRSIILLKADPDDSTATAAIELGKQYSDARDTTDIEAQIELAKVADDAVRYEELINTLEQTEKFAFEEMARVRIETALAKIPYVIKFIEEQLESVGKIIVGCWHHEVVEAIINHWPLESMSIYGKTKTEERQANVDRFQNDPSCKLAVLSSAGYEGITLTAASTVDVIELPWKPGQLDQLESRADRIGQKNCVNVNHLLLEDSIDVKMAKTIISKQRTIDAVLNDEAEEKAAPERTATKSLTREKIIEEVNKLDHETIPYIHKALIELCGNDQDYARAINNVGFSKIDVKIGHSLAACSELTAKQAVLGKKLCRKYRRQISDFIYEKIFGEVKK